jgi:hypothetical protein
MSSNRHERRSAARSAASAAHTSRETSRSRILVTILALLALAIQMLAVQSHVHRAQTTDSFLSDSLGGHLAGAANSSRAQHHKYPDDQDPSKCPFCQQLGHSGQFVASTVVLLSFRSCVTVIFVAYTESARVLGAVRHSWQSRAPPRR